MTLRSAFLLLCLTAQVACGEDAPDCAALEATALDDRTSGYCTVVAPPGGDRIAWACDREGQTAAFSADDTGLMMDLAAPGLAPSTWQVSPAEVEAPWADLARREATAFVTFAQTCLAEETCTTPDAPLPMLEALAAETAQPLGTFALGSAEASGLLSQGGLEAGPDAALVLYAADDTLWAVVLRRSPGFAGTEATLPTNVDILPLPEKEAICRK